MEVSLIGAGNMGTAMLKGWIESGVFKKNEVFAFEKDSNRAKYIEAEYGVKTAHDINSDYEGSKIAVLSVKPQDCIGVLKLLENNEIKPEYVISIVAGLPISKIRQYIGMGPNVVRVMPNMAALVGFSISAYAVDKGTGAFNREIVGKVLGSIGDSIEMDEKQLNLVTAVSGSGPAYFYYLVEAMINAACGLGMDDNIAVKLVEKTFIGAARVMESTGRDAEDLRKSVSSPGGTTVAGLNIFESMEMDNIVSKAIEAACKRAGELTQK